MDPNKTLVDLLDALRDRDAEGANVALLTLHRWVDSGGFLPTDPRTPAPGEASAATVILCQQYANLICAANRAQIEILEPAGDELATQLKNLGWSLIHTSPKEARPHLDLCKRVAEVCSDEYVTNPAVILARASVRVP